MALFGCTAKFGRQDKLRAQGNSIARDQQVRLESSSPLTTMSIAWPVTWSQRIHIILAYLEDSQQDADYTLLLLATALAVAAAASYSFYFKTPKNDFILTGAAWISELIRGHPQRIAITIDMEWEVFPKLVEALENHGLKNSSKGVGTKEQVAIFLHWAVTGNYIRQMNEQFQRSNGTISMYVIYKPIINSYYSI